MKGKIFLIFSIAVIGLLAVRGVALAHEIHLFDRRGGSAGETIHLIYAEPAPAQLETNPECSAGLEPGDDKSGSAMNLSPTQTVDDKGGSRTKSTPTAQPGDDYGGYRSSGSGGY